MGMLQEFKAFALKGNVIDLAVGVIIGTGFAKIVDAMVADLIMPLVSILVGEVDFSKWFLILGHVPADVPRTLEALKTAGIPVFAWGHFLSISLNFFMLAFVIFVMIRQVHKLRIAHEAKPADTPPAPPSEEVQLLREIRDSLKAKP